MADSKLRRLRVLHLVGADGKSGLNPLLLPLLTRGNRERIEVQVINFVPGSARFAVVRQSGLPVHEVALSRQRFSPLALNEIRKIIGEFNPDLVHAWGLTAQIVANLLCGWGAKALPIVWSVNRTAPLYKNDGWLDKRKVALAVKFAEKCKRIVFPSAVAAANHRREGVPEEKGLVISSGVDAERFKPDDAARVRVREQLELPKDAIVVGMYAPFQPEYDHGTLLKGVGELTRVNPNLYCVLAGRGLVRGNAPLMAMVGGGTLGTRTRVIGEWTDLSALFNACDVVCSTATADTARLQLAMSMLCGVMCVATGVGAQGEVLGNFGVSIEIGSPEAVSRGIRRLLEMPTDRKAFMTLEARKHVLQNFNMTRSIEKYHELYIELITGEAPAQSAVVESSAKDKAQSQAIAEIIANRAAAIAHAARAQPAKTEAAAEKAPVESASEDFGSVASKEPAPATPSPAPTIAAKVETAKNEEAPQPKRAPQNDTIDFEAYTVSSAVKTTGAKDEESTASTHWSDDDAKLMDDILIEADPATAKANADKAAAATKATAAKAAANAAFAAALANGGDAAGALDPKLIAALNLSRAQAGGSKAVAGKPPPAPELAAASEHAVDSVPLNKAGKG